MIGKTVRVKTQLPGETAYSMEDYEIVDVYIDKEGERIYVGVGEDRKPRLLEFVDISYIL